MKLFIKGMLSVALIASVVCVKAQTNWAWALNGEASNSTFSQYHFSISDNGEITVVGAFTGSVISPTGVKYSAGGQDIFIAHYSASQQLLWLKTGGGLWDDIANSVVEDKAGNIYITGSYTDTANFDGTLLYSQDSIHQSAAFRGDIFLAKYDRSGNQIWLKRAGGIWKDLGRSLALDNSNNLYLTGVYGSGIFYFTPYGTATFDNVTLQSPGDGGMFLAKYDTAGALKWIKSAGGRYNINPWKLRCNDSGSIYITGALTQPYVYFDSIKASVANSSIGGMFLVKYDSTGTAKWARTAYGTRPTYGNDICFDLAGNLFLVGEITSPLTTFGFGINLLGSQDRYNGYIAKYASNGDILWAKNAGINLGDYNYVNSVIIDKQQNIYTAGSFADYSYLGGDTIKSFGAEDVQISKYDSTGNPIWSAYAGTTERDDATDLMIDSNGGLYVTGVVNSQLANFGTTSFTNTSGNWNMFIAKLVQWPLGVNGDPVIHTTSLYPNPSSGLFTIKWQTGHYDRAIIINAAGTVVSSQKLSPAAKAYTFFQPSLPDGVYSIGLQDGRHTSFTKLVIRH